MGKNQPTVTVEKLVRIIGAFGEYGQKYELCTF